MKKQLPILLCEDGKGVDVAALAAALGCVVISYDKGALPPKVFGCSEIGTVIAMGFSADGQEED